jgi:two-component system sensor histidine kinase QseC
MEGRLVARSSGAPDAQMTDQASGFSQRIVEGEPWRVYTVEDAAKNIRVMVGDRLGMRDGLVADLIKGLVLPALLILPLLAALIWISLGRGLRPLNAMAGELRGRGADDLSLIETRRAPAEVQPLIAALNGLFAKVEAARRHERDLTAFAAHELRTPLAGLKTQAQIALSVADPAIREGALRQILISVDRTSRLVRQLLAIARLDAGLDDASRETLNIGKSLDEVINMSKPPMGSIKVNVDPDLHGFFINANREALYFALRNLHENAIQHSHGGGAISWRVAPERTGVLVEDDGPGIPASELPFVTQRFFRGEHKSPTGTGLGLAITEIAVQKLGGKLVLVNREGRSGLRALIILPGVVLP